MIFVLSVLLCLSTAFASPFVQSIAKQETIQHGKMGYEKRCAGCHGEKGDGNGIAAPFLDPKPRNFTSGIYKFRSSPLGTLPSDKDLMHTLSKGVLGTSMPNFADVPEQERFAIVQYVKTFSKMWDDPANFQGEVVGTVFPQEDFTNYKTFIERAKRGRSIFIEACVLCHGKNGYGDGESAADLVDDWNEKIIPANLSKTFIKSGRSIKDIYLRLLTGVGGTPMPSFKDTYTDDQLWDVAAWVFYLRGVESKIYEAPLPLPMIQDSEVQ
jgi:cytochrome c oxidase cbb3-type subunit I/II